MSVRAKLVITGDRRQALTFLLLHGHALPAAALR
jgi:hypothetical protein